MTRFTLHEVASLMASFIPKWGTLEAKNLDDPRVTSNAPTELTELQYTLAWVAAAKKL